MIFKKNRKKSKNTKIPLPPHSKSNKDYAIQKQFHIDVFYFLCGY